MFGKICIPTIIMIGVVLLLKFLIPLQITSKFSCIVYVAIISIVGAVIYLVISYKLGILTTVFGKEYIQKIVRKLTFGKVKNSKNTV